MPEAFLCTCVFSLVYFVSGCDLLFVPTSAHQAQHELESNLSDVPFDAICGESLKTVL